MIANQDPDLSRAVVDRDDTEAYRLLPFRSPAAYEVFDYADQQRDLRLADPQDDVINALTVAQSEGVLNEQEFHNYFGVLMIAGNETTRHTISHGMLALIEHPEQLKLLQEEPDRIPRATEEILRWATPVHHFRRTATRDLELRGAEIRAGRQGRDVVLERQPRRGGLPRAVHVRRHADAERPRDVRAGWAALLPWARTSRGSRRRSCSRSCCRG